MKRIILLFLFLSTIHFALGQDIKIMLVTGGHAFDTLQFFQLFDGLEGVEYEHFEQPKANAELVKGKAYEFDVLVFYDMWNTISMEEKAAYVKLTKQGKPFLFLHHSLASYQKWPDFEQMIGGKYVEKDKNVAEEMFSTYEHDVWVYCSIENYTPVTSGFRELRFFDEVYGNIRISDNVKPLLRTRHPQSSEFVAWQNVYNKSNIVYIQPGHDKRTYESEDYGKLILQAIKYLAIKN
ncbi:ThuA domain-containing protein [Prolixibacteraceae bacterium Z1-6]|uniref:ThuA domain-containing protein n=1 Tax=Draconibacterium aestuarii TaxID=2998507 RepID=A0A9X3J8T5_9BACT|nr:ThuA domain-containing protein [Prolixibacteraceae bacterium Z1-6]